MNLLTVDHITKVYTQRELFHDASFYLQDGEKVGIIGINGTGKSTLLKIMAGLEEPDAGNVVWANHLVIRYLPQMPEFHAGETVLESVVRTASVGNSHEEKTTEQHEAWNLESEAKTLMTRLGITDFDQKTEYLSGGQKKRVTIATVLAMEPSVLVMDEPTSNLDPRARRQIIDLIRRFSHTTLIATHDMEMVLDLCDRTIVMKEGRIVADGSTRHVFGDLALLEECGLEQPCELRMKRALKKEYAP